MSIHHGHFLARHHLDLAFDLGALEKLGNARMFCTFKADTGCREELEKGRQQGGQREGYTAVQMRDDGPGLGGRPGDGEQWVVCLEA